MRLLICAGGTGGGVYPALAVLKCLKADSAPLDVLWIGSEGGMEADLIARNDIAYDTIPAAGVHGVGLGTLPGNLMQLGRGFFAARKILRRFRPDLLFFTGGYVAVPMALAGMRKPSALYVPDIEPGLALKTLANFANLIAV
ncbi:MAG: UDP-N-acetylglucosamine--N-acetylmuramyl-(pentapeptide) pyrophosphoryl-undecaprenol N-acetylglucosamine transferase, partial [Anaerolineae bacterium]|nr:UDP-N-acetylglucosamine--N-acetylmuramyl-(pentapeptide) pyrophosphoryl-undecaprenol N-acetylglucosamine transferase [Anaerolineae bacterium]